MQVTPDVATASTLLTSVPFLTIIAQFISQIKVNGVASFVIQRIKESDMKVFSWITTKTPWVTRAVAAAAAAGTAVGIHATYNNTGVLTVTGLTLTGIVTLLWAIAQNYLMQHAWYKTVFAPQNTPLTVEVPAGVKLPPATPIAVAHQ